ncbi:MAG: OmpA family protein [Bryobacteraceae bacterium]|nr:OmpA family protein [Bryobacteraceae bacterium]
MTTPPPIIIVRKIKKGHGHHGGAWKVAYADFVTAMMALFIVLWLLASSEEVQKAVGGYFSDPTGQGKMQGSTMAGIGETLVVSRDDMSELKAKIEQAMREMPKFDQLKNNVQITVTHEGLRIELLENDAGLFFDTGSARMSERGSEIIRLLAAELGTLPNKLLLEGHTDAKPYASTLGYTNWELSADRANTARRILIEGGVPPHQVAQIRGFADQHLRNAEDPFDPANRRVSLIVQYRNLDSSPAQRAEPVKQ